LTPQQAVALQIAQEYGAGAALLARLAGQASRIERNFVNGLALTVYPLAVGSVLFVNILLTQLPLHEVRKNNISYKSRRKLFDIGRIYRKDAQTGV